jgi:hypothetical protein
VVETKGGKKSEKRWLRHHDDARSRTLEDPEFAENADLIFPMKTTFLT